MTASGPRVLVVGDVMTDIIVCPEGPLVLGSDRRASICSRPGGSGANQAVWLAAMGVDVRFVAKVGAGDMGTLGQHFLDFGVEAMLRPDYETPSGVLVNIIAPSGERSFFTDRGANLFLCEHDLPVALLNGTSNLILSGYSYFAEQPRRAVRALAAEARRRSIPVVVDPASESFLREIGPNNFLAWTLGASLLFANSDEAGILSGASELEDQLAFLATHYDRVIIKRGAQGAVLATRSASVIELPALQVPVLDTTGAGDAFAAGFIAAELEGAAPEACLKAALHAGARAVQHFGGQPQPTALAEAAAPNKK